MGFGTLYVQTDGDVDKTKSEIEKLKKKRTPETKHIIAVRKLEVIPGRVYTITLDKDKANLMVEFDYDKNTNLKELQHQVSGITGVRIVKSTASL
jgi:hypothetical protein